MKKPQIAQDLIQAVETAENYLNSLNAQQVDLEKRNQQLSFDISSSTKKLLAQQQEELASKTKTERKVLAELETKIESSQKLYDAYIEDIKGLEAERMRLQDVTKQLKNITERLQEDRSSATEQFQALKGDITSYRHELDQLKTATAAEALKKEQLIGENQVLQDTYDDLNRTSEGLEVDITTKRSGIAEEEAKHARVVATAKEKLDDFASYEQKTREDLSHREMDLDEREKVVSIRERKVDDQEAMVRNNASLLDL